MKGGNLDFILGIHATYFFLLTNDHKLELKQKKLAKGNYFCYIHIDINVFLAP